MTTLKDLIRDVVVQNFKEKCDHICTSDCRRKGCNCSCGEFHDDGEDLVKEIMVEIKDWLNKIAELD